jgi:polyferredoxin/Na+-translocating ferredoxin:NAD+ oxidoreductase RnfG subunit
MSKRPAESWFVHVFRLLVLFCILILFHAIHQREMSRKTSTPFATLAEERIEAIFGTGCRISTETSADRLSVIDQDGSIVGSIAQTSPQSDRSVGFSGPTNVLIAFGSDDLVRHVSILSSGDTRDHIKLIENDVAFFRSFEGKTVNALASLPKVQAVTGATLSSTSIIQGIQRRFGASVIVSKFPSSVTVDDAQLFFQDTKTVKQDTAFPSLWFAIDDRGRECGWLLRTSPISDDAIGYQGPTDALLAMNIDGQIVGLHVGKSFDNDPYVGYVRKDAGFRSFWKKFTIQSLRNADLREEGMEGVSGATMSSMAIAEAIIKAAKELDKSNLSKAQSAQSWYSNLYRAIGTGTIIFFAIALCFSHWRGNRWTRTIYQMVVIVYLGFLQGELLSVAMFVGWTQNGVPWQSAAGLLLLTITAVFIPIATKRNIYCSHLCPHGAIQQLLPRRWQWKKELSSWFKKGLVMIRPILLLWVIVVVMFGLPFGLVDIEPFDAYAWRAAAVSSLIVAIGGIIFSLFIPMGYCRYGCVTGGLLNYLRRNPNNSKLQRADYLSLACLIVGSVIYFADRI